MASERRQGLADEPRQRLDFVPCDSGDVLQKVPMCDVAESTLSVHIVHSDLHFSTAKQSLLL